MSTIPLTPAEPSFPGTPSSPGIPAGPGGPGGPAGQSLGGGLEQLQLFGPQPHSADLFALARVRFGMPDRTAIISIQASSAYS
ncbi:unnamed protein product [Heligmosomoides polygyrus]|uniref:PPE-SVP domain-containing protein n=1 Tax=Heligmosomoides polygyrus TaxID=6339 RepID=A0A183FDK8_HELPZ|nr:unnamed protein product [Heligmosomoides polygyrus]